MSECQEVIDNQTVATMRQHGAAALEILDTAPRYHLAGRHAADVPELALNTLRWHLRQITDALSGTAPARLPSRVGEGDRFRPVTMRMHREFSDECKRYPPVTMPAAKACEVCHGDGYVTPVGAHPHPCLHCDGTGLCQSVMAE